MSLNCSDGKVTISAVNMGVGDVFYLPVDMGNYDWDVRTWRIESFHRGFLYATPTHMPNTLHRFTYGNTCYDSYTACKSACDEANKLGKKEVC